MCVFHFKSICTVSEGNFGNKLRTSCSVESVHAHQVINAWGRTELLDGNLISELLSNNGREPNFATRQTSTTISHSLKNILSLPQIVASWCLSNSVFITVIIFFNVITIIIFVTNTTARCTRPLRRFQNFLIMVPGGCIARACMSLSSCSATCEREWERH